MPFAQLHKRIGYLFAALGMGALMLTDELEPWFRLCAVLVACLSYFSETLFARSGVTEQFWRTWSTRATIAVFVFQIARIPLGASTLTVLLEFAIWLQLSRLFTRFRAEDYRQIAFIAFVHLLGATILTTDFSYALLFLGFVVVVPWSLALTHIRQFIETREAVEKIHPDNSVVHREPVVARGFLLGSAMLSVPLFVVTGLIFLLFPRVGLGFIALGGGHAQSVSGFGGQVELGQIGRIREDESVIMRITPFAWQAENAVVPAPGARLSLHLRGSTFDRYNGGSWTRTNRQELSTMQPQPPRMVYSELGSSSVNSRLARAVPQMITYLPLARTHRQRDVALDIRLEHISETVMFFPQPIVSIEVPGLMVSGLSRARELRSYWGFETRYDDSEALGINYRAWVADAEWVSDPAFSDDAMIDEGHPLPEDFESLDVADKLSIRVSLMYLQMPIGHEATRRLAAQWTRTAHSDIEAVREIARMLRDSGQYQYSLEMSDPGQQAPLDAFLTRTHSGHCEYFATAMVLLARSANVPARLVTGFSGGEYNNYGKFLAIRSSDAHAWAEVWLQGRGWVTVDATPAQANQRPPATLGQLRRFWDAMRGFWANSIVDFDLRSQQRVAMNFYQWLRRNRQTTETNAARAPSEASARTTWKPSWPLLVLLGLAIAAMVLWSRRGPEVRRDTKLYLRVLAALRVLGITIEKSDTANDVVQAASDKGIVDPDLELFFRRYKRSRFGQIALDESEVQRANALLQRLEKRKAS